MSALHILFFLHLNSKLGPLKTMFTLMQDTDITYMGFVLDLFGSTIDPFYEKEHAYGGKWVGYK